MLLSLPVLAPEVPAVIEFSPAGERHLRLVLAMSRMGMILDEDLAGLRRTRMSANAIRVLIEKGWQRAVSGDYEYKLLSAFARLILPDEAEEQEFVAEDGTPLVGVAINAAQPEWMTIGPVFAAIEAMHPGLGRKALKVLESPLCHFGMPHTPGGAFELCQQLYWQGEDDETTALEEWGDEADEADIPRRAVMFDGVPEWAYMTHVEGHPSITDEEFHALAVQYAAHPTGKLLSALSRLLTIENESDQFAPAHEGYGWSNEPPIVCGWDTETDFDAIFDDNYRYFCESGEEPPWVGCVKFACTEEGIANALPAIRHTGSVLSALDSALNEIRNFQP